MANDSGEPVAVDAERDRNGSGSRSGTDIDLEAVVLTLAEAARLAGVSDRALRKRAERLTLRVGLEERDGRQVQTVTLAALAEHYPASVLRWRQGPEAVRYGSGPAQPSQAAWEPAGSTQSEPEPDVEHEPVHEPAEPAAGHAALQVAGSLVLRLRAEIAGEVERLHLRADRLERQATGTRRWAVGGWTFAALAVVAGMGLAWQRDVRAAERVGESQRAAQERQDRADAQHAAELERVRLDAQAAAQRAQVAALAQGLGVRMIGELGQ